jgi:hypothetical protein
LFALIRSAPQTLRYENRPSSPKVISLGRLLHLEFSDRQTRELFGERDLSMTEANAVIARGIGKPDLRYEQFPYDQVLPQMGVPPKAAPLYIEMYKARPN